MMYLVKMHAASTPSLVWGIPLWRIFTAGCGSVQSAKWFHLQKWACSRLSRTGLTVLLRWGTESLKGSWPFWATQAIHWLVDRIIPVMRQEDNNKQTQYPPGISGQRRKLLLLKKMSPKSLPSFLDVLHCCSLLIVRVFLFPWIY